MYAFWGYDLYPHLHGGKVTEDHGDGTYSIGQMRWRAMFTLPDEPGKALHAKLEALSSERAKAEEIMRRLFNDKRDSIVRSFGFKNTKGEKYLPEYVPATTRRAPTRMFTWIAALSVDSSWVADGFDLTDERALDMLSGDLRMANIGTELDAKVIAAPDADTIAREQGYKDAAEMRADDPVTYSA